VDRVAGVIDQVDRVGELVSSMLDVSRADLGKLTIAPAPIDAARLVQEVVGQFESQLGERKVVLVAPDELPVEWDPLRVQQILINLVTNAMRYAPEGDIDVTVMPGEGDTVAISVRDRGPGVPLHLRRRLFRLFYRMDGEETANGRARHHGLGIGLYISAHLAEAHGGALSVDDAEGGGAVFTLTLPRVATSQS
ncbi:MAG: HAMP domain-containing histidine kinase, partial [Chloroflexota bacterium]|nr:HAMP domain-containing histidine kinase [Chloroflexota bacterium]